MRGGRKGVREVGKEESKVGWEMTRSERSRERRE